MPTGLRMSAPREKTGIHIRIRKSTRTTLTRIAARIEGESPSGLAAKLVEAALTLPEGVSPEIDAALARKPASPTLRAMIEGLCDRMDRIERGSGVS
jgi:hypothetical protein